MSELRAELGETLARARAHTLALVRDLNDDASRTQFHPDFSPLGWHLGHIAWQEECFALRRAGGQSALVSVELDELYDSFRSRKGGRAARLPSLSELLEYLDSVRSRTLSLLESVDLNAPGGSCQRGEVFRFLANHERQHAETMGVVRILGELYLPPASGERRRQVTPSFVALPGGEFLLGTDADPDAWDNERCAHRVEVDDFELYNVPVTNAEWLAFMGHGGYERRELWDAAGWQWRCAQGIVSPAGWQRRAEGWQVRTLSGGRAPHPDHPVCHVSWYEAQAYACYANARLPSEREWEYAASAGGAGKRRWSWGDRPAEATANLDLSHPGTTPVGAFPAGASRFGIHDLSGNVWEWTSDAFAAFPGFEPQAYAGYSKPWFDGAHRVARGGSFLTQREIARNTFRNFYLPQVREVALGVRLAR